MNSVRARYGRAALVVLLAAYGVFSTTLSHDGWQRTGYLTVIAVCAAALLVRRLPWIAAPTLLTAAALALDYRPTLPLLCVALFDLATNRHARVALGCVFVAFGVKAVAAAATTSWDDLSGYTGAILVALLCVLGGLWRGSRRRTYQLLAEQVEQLKVEAELREEAARITERSRIAAEMHDVLAHRLSLIALHTGVLVSRTDDLPDRVTERLRLLRAASAEALADLRDVLGALHTAQPSENHAELTPPIGRVADLVTQARDAGQDVDLHVHGEPELAPTTHRLAAFRIVQEALTNARKHADGATVTVRVGYRPPTTLVEVTSTAGRTAAGAVVSGYGLVGLRERLSALGGHLRAGPTPTGSWQLSAAIPHPNDTSTDRPAP